MTVEHDVVERVLEAHGAEHLERARSVRVRFSSGGLAFALKGQPAALRQCEAELAPTRQQITVRGKLPSPWEVSINDSADLQERLGALHTGTRRLRWAPEDVGVFAAGALWTYITLPLLLRDSPVRVRRRTPATHELVVDLRRDIAGHAPRQVVHVDDDGRIVRHDYTAIAFGRWARAAQTVTAYRNEGDLSIGTARRVTPRAGRWKLPAPTLVWIELHELDVTCA